MAVQAKTYLDLAGLTAYDGKIKDWSNSIAQAGIKTVIKTADGNSLKFYKKPSAVESDTADFTIELGSSDAATKITALASVLGVTWDSTNNRYNVSFDSSLVATTFAAAINEVISDFNAFIGEIPSGATATTVIGYIGEAINNKVATLDGSATIASKSGNVVTIKGGITEADGVVSNDSSSDITLEEVAVTGAAEDVSTTAITDGKATPSQLYAAGNAQDVLEAIARDLNDLTSESVVTVEKQATAETGFASTYVVKQNNSQVGVKINIPKDFLVKSATLETVETADVPYSGAKVGDKYIDLVVNAIDASETAQHIYLPVNDLVDVYTGDDTAEVSVNVDSNNVITATIVKIDSAKIDYSTTTTVKDELDKLNGADTVTGSVAKAKKDAIDTVVGASTDTATANTVNGAKAYADDAVNTAVGGLDGSASIASYVAGTSGAADVITLKGGITEADGVVNNSSADDITLSTITATEINALFA